MEEPPNSKSIENEQLSSPEKDFSRKPLDPIGKNAVTTGVAVMLISKVEFQMFRKLTE